MIQMLRDAKIENIMALRGDIVPGEDIKREFAHANELAIEIQRKSRGELEIMGACYPEGHYEANSLEEDIQNLKYKIGAGVSGLVTQLFFDNQKFYDFVEKVRAAGITVPISAGIMPITNKRQIERTVALSGSSLPKKFTNMIAKYEDDPDGLFDAGIEYAVFQIRDLIEHGVDGIHLYTMNNAKVAQGVTEKIADLLPERG
jgi:methylenetetrahydrofolate reductase (NADPH)